MVEPVGQLPRSGQGFLNNRGFGIKLHSPTFSILG
jgi:hypothetical protein